jgi:hypothetical protein
LKDLRKRLRTNESFCNDIDDTGGHLLTQRLELTLDSRFVRLKPVVI